MSNASTNTRVYHPLSTVDEAETSTEQLGEPFPLHCLPPDAVAMAQACVEVYGVPANLAGCCVLGLLSASVGAGLQVRSLADRCTRGNLYLLATAASGSGKSETFRAVIEPFFEYQDQWMAGWQRNVFPIIKAELGALRAEIAVLESSFKGKRGVKPSEEERKDLIVQLAEKEAAMMELSTQSREPTFYVEDTTEQRLETLMQQPGETLACLSDDARQVTDNIMGRNRSNGAVEDGFWVKAWTGGRHKVDRANGRNLILKNPCLSALLLVQDDKLRAMLARPELSEGGFLPRALLCRTGCEPKEIDRSRGAIPAEVKQGWKHLVCELLEHFRQAQAPITIAPTAEAEQVMDAHFNSIVPRRRTGGDLADVASFPARWNEEGWRIAVCLHAGLHGKSAADHPLVKGTAECALILGDWFAQQQLKILASMRSDAHRERLTRLLTLLAGYGGQATLRDLATRNGFDADEVRRLEKEFPSLLKVDRQPTGGRPTEFVTAVKNAFSHTHPPAEATKPAKAIRRS